MKKWALFLTAGLLTLPLVSGCSKAEEGDPTRWAQRELEAKRDELQTLADACKELPLLEAQVAEQKIRQRQLQEELRRLEGDTP